jgi:dTMP kinase
MRTGHSMTRPTWITIEGINGVGKTYLGQQVAHHLGPDCLHLTELTDQQADRLPGQVIAAMASRGGTFLRTGHPLTETLALIALKVREYENVDHSQTTARVVLEDRGIDTVAIYQAAILSHPSAPREHVADMALRVFRTAVEWRPLPRRTLLLTDAPDACLARFSARIGVSIPEDDQALVRRIHAMYLDHASAQPDRFIVIDRCDREEADVVEEMAHHCRALMEDHHA